MTSSAPAAMPSVEDVARVLCEARHQMLVSPDQWAAEMAHIREMEAKHPTYITGFSTGTDAVRQARAILDFFAPILVEKESLRRELHSLAVALHRKHYWHVKQWKPFDDALGLATQIDNMTAGLVPEARALAAEAALAAERERCALIAEDVCATPPADFAWMELEAFRRGADAMSEAIAAALRAQGE